MNEPEENKSFKGWLLALVLVAAYALIFSPCAQSQEKGEEWLAFNWTSHHFDRTKPYNEDNLGLIWEHKFSNEWRTGLGYIQENSFYKPSGVGYVAYTPLRLLTVDLGGVVGLASGYTEDVLTPVMGLYGTKEWKHVGINAQLNPAAILFQIKAKLSF